MSGMRDWTNVKDVSILATNSSTADRLFDFVLPPSVKAKKAMRQDQTKNFMSEFPSSDLKFASRNYMYPLLD